MKLARDNKLAKLVFAQFSIGQVKSLEACSCPGYTRGSTGPQNIPYNQNLTRITWIVEWQRLRRGDVQPGRGR